ncbi:MAG: hypothetical protein EA428_07165 [Spirochaetaceae bacterium]|nr:MAG: hypothetical protein EA428_07165 [Spirochaetaceae bacterium]
MSGRGLGGTQLLNERANILDRSARIVPDRDSPEPSYPQFVSRAKAILGEVKGVPVSDLIQEDRGERV